MKELSGLDVHKDTIFCAVYNGKKQHEVKEFATFTQSIRDMGNYLTEQGVKEVAMESTGIYWIPIWNVLEDMGFVLTLVNPFQIKQMPGRKSDVKDAQWIAELLYKRMLKGSLIPCKRIRELRSFSRKYVQLQGKITGLLVEMENLLEVSNIRITSLVSNISGKSVIEVIKKIIDKKYDTEELSKCIHGRIINSKGKKKVEMALEGHIQEHHRVLLEMTYEQYELLLKQSERLEEEMLRICQTSYEEELRLLRTLPGVSRQSAMQIIAETGADMSVFENSGKLTGWAGLRPRNDETAGKMKSTAVTKGNKYLRRIMVQCAWAASRTKGSHFKERFEKLSIRKSRKKALIANARKLLTVIWNMLSYKQVYDPKKQPVHSVNKLKNKIKYHQKQIEQLKTQFSVKDDYLCGGTVPTKSGITPFAN